MLHRGHRVCLISLVVQSLPKNLRLVCSHRLSLLLGTPPVPPHHSLDKAHCSSLHRYPSLLSTRRCLISYRLFKIALVGNKNSKQPKRKWLRSNKLKLNASKILCSRNNNLTLLSRKKLRLHPCRWFLSSPVCHSSCRCLLHVRLLALAVLKPCVAGLPVLVCPLSPVLLLIFAVVRRSRSLPSKGNRLWLHLKPLVFVAPSLLHLKRALPKHHPPAVVVLPEDLSGVCPQPY